MSAQPTAAAPLDLVCVVPVYNEEAVLAQAIPLLLDALRTQYADWRIQIVIADNGSRDRTREIALRLADTSGGQIAYTETTQKGRGYAFRQAFADPAFTARRYLYVDVDLPCELDDLARVVAPLEDGADLVLCRRTGYRPLGRRVMTLGLRMLNHWVLGLRASDSQCAVKALSPAAVTVMLRDCGEVGWFLDTELAAMASRRGLHTREVPIRWIEQRFEGRASKVNIVADIERCLTAIARIRRRQHALDRPRVRD